MPVTINVNLVRPQRTINDLITPGVYNGDTVESATVDIDGALATDGSAPQTGTQTGDWKVAGNGEYGGNLIVAGTLNLTGLATLATLQVNTSATLTSTTLKGTTAVTTGSFTVSSGVTSTFNGSVVCQSGFAAYGKIMANGGIDARSNTHPNIDLYSLRTSNYAHIGGGDNANNGPASQIRRLYCMHARCTLPALGAGGAAWYSLSPTRDTVYQRFDLPWQSASDQAAFDASAYKITRGYRADGMTNNDFVITQTSDPRFAADACCDTTNTRLQVRNVSGGAIAAGTTVNVTFFMVSPYAL